MERCLASFHIIELSLLVVSAILQLVSLVAPGWLIIKNRNSEKYMGVFYAVECSTSSSSCSANSYHDAYHDTVAKLESLGLNTATKDFEYHQTVWMQVLEILAFVCLLACIVMQIYKETSGQVETHRPLMTVAVIALLAFSGAIMLNRLSTFYILTNHIQNLDDTDLGFPYCIMMYNLAFLANLVVFTLYVIEVARAKQQGQEQYQRYNIEFENMAPYR